jgi:hypothetical protein
MKQLTEQWAICQFYEPFRLGGPLWDFVRFKVNGSPIILDRDIEAFIYTFPKPKEYRVHHTQTGGLLGSGKTQKAAIEMANYNISMTPDIFNQFLTLGPVLNHREVQTHEAFNRLSKSKR